MGTALEGKGEKEMTNKFSGKDGTKQKKVKTYPGVRFDNVIKKYVASHKKDGVVYVSTSDTFEGARAAKIKLESE